MSSSIPWSVEGFREEGTTTAEMGWGTHEKELPAMAFEHADGQEPDLLARMGMNTLVASWVPPIRIVGMIVRHGEASPSAIKLTVWEGGKAIYRPRCTTRIVRATRPLPRSPSCAGYDYRLQPRSAS